MHATAAHRALRPARPAALAAVLAAMVLVVVGPAPWTRAVGAAPTDAPAAEVPAEHTLDRVEVAAHWSRNELERVASTAEAGGVVDVGLTLDHVLALLAAGRERATVDRVLRAIEPRVAGYVAANPTMPVSGHLAKTLFTAAATGRPTTYGGVDLAGELRANMVTDGDRVGELPSYRGATSGEGFYQAWAVLALARAGGAPPETVEFLLHTQCPTGGFPTRYGERPEDGCRRGGHVDATAMAVQALQVVPRTPGTTAAIERAADWLVAVQGPHGGLSDNDGRPPNTNSTGLASQALRAAGRTSAADRARGWVEARQLLCPAPAGDRGGFAWVDAAEGVDPRAHPQAMLALGLAPYGAIGGGGSAPARPLWCPDGDGPGGDVPPGDDPGRDASPRPPVDGGDPVPEATTGTAPPSAGPDGGAGSGGGAYGDPGAGPVGAADSLRRGRSGGGPGAPGSSATDGGADQTAAGEPGDDRGERRPALGRSRPATVREASRPRSIVPVTAGAATVALAALIGIRSGVARRRGRSVPPVTSAGSGRTPPPSPTAAPAVGATPRAVTAAAPPSADDTDDTDGLPTYV